MGYPFQLGEGNFDRKRLEAALKEAGVEVSRQVNTGVVHEFFGMDAVLDDAQRAQEHAAEALKAALDSGEAATKP